MFRFMNLKLAIHQLLNQLMIKSPILRLANAAREIGFGSYEIGGYNAASHWVAISAKNWTDLILTRRKMKELTKEWDEYYKKRGNVEHVRNYTTNIVKRY